jgi:hypothetical protein
MNKALISLASAAAIAAATVAIPQTANAGDGGAIAAGVIGGLAAGAIIGGAAAHGGYYGPGPVYYGAYGGPAPGCVIRRERVWDGYGWRVQRVRVCY